MAGGGGRSDDGLYGTQIGRGVCILQAGQESTHGIEGIFLEHEAEHTTEAFHLPPGDGVARMGFEARIKDPFDSRMGLQELRDGRGIAVLPGHPERQRL